MAWWRACSRRPLAKNERGLDDSGGVLQPGAVVDGGNKTGEHAVDRVVLNRRPMSGLTEPVAGTRIAEQLIKRGGKRLNVTGLVKPAVCDRPQGPAIPVD